MEQVCCWSSSSVASRDGVWAGPKPCAGAAFPSTEGKFCCSAEGPEEAFNEGDDEEGGGEEEDGGMAESLHSTCPSPTWPTVGTSAAAAPEVTVIAAVVMVTVLRSFLADAWQ